MFKKLKNKRWTLGKKLNRSNLGYESPNQKRSRFGTSFASTEAIESKRSKREAFLIGGKPRDLRKIVSKTDIHRTWDFSSISLTPNGLIDAACELLLEGYIELNKVQKLNVSDKLIRAAIRSFILDVEKGYSKSCFHNFAHAVDVAQLMFTLITQFFYERIKKEELFYLLIAALCHDLGHIGVTTPTLQKLECLNDNGSLEDFHTAETLALFQNNDLSLFSPRLLKKKYFSELKTYCRILIDATDISKCDIFLKAAQQKAQETTFQDNLPMEHLCILMKISDLANVTRSFKDSFKWGEYLKIEFTSEKLFNETFSLPKSLTKKEILKLVKQEVFVFQRQIRDDKANLRKDLAKNTLKFMEFAVKPIFEVLPEISPLLSVAYERRVSENEKTWRHMAANRL